MTPAPAFDHRSDQVLPALLFPKIDFIPEQRGEVIAAVGPYQARLAASPEERRAAYRLRFLVFNLELNEGLESAYQDGYDTDRFDAVCDHLIVEHTPTNTVVGTYRMQPGTSARNNFGYYSEQEFDFAPYEAMRAEIVELGRACVHRDHRTSDVLNLLWRGIMRYAVRRGSRYLMGCCSLTSQDAAEGLAVHHALRQAMVAPELMTVPTPAYALPPYQGELPTVVPPRLLRAYLAVGARICSAPAIDRDFGTIDYLTLLDINAMNDRIRSRYL